MTINSQNTHAPWFQFAIAFFMLAVVAASLSAETKKTDTTHADTKTLSTFDQLKAAAQKICPVSGKPLGSMGDPVKMKIGQEHLFLCCEGCVRGKVDKQHWLTIHKNLAAAQKLCPVMEKPLPNNPKSTVVQGNMIYICCPPCTKKIQADPKTHLTKLAGYYRAAVETKGQVRPENHAGTSVTSAVATSAAATPDSGHASHTSLSSSKPTRDQLKASVQKICPVSGRELGSMGKPLKVQAGGMDVFLCCEGCKEGKIQKSHWLQIRNNFAKAQNLCPVMELELPEAAKSTIVDGSLVFVCCPPCTKKIESDPKTFLDKVHGYYVSSLQNTDAPNLR